MTNNHARINAFLSAVLTATLVVGHEQTAADEAAPLLGSDTCRNADIRVLNSRSDSITVRSVEYYNASEGRWQTENLANRVVSPDALEFWSEDLEHSEDNLITSFNVTFDHGSHNGHVAHVNTPDQTCIPGRVFLLEIQ